MFEKLKQIGKMREIQKSLKDEEVEVEKKGVKIVVNGNLDVVSVALNAELEKEEQEKLLKDCFNEAMSKIKISMAQKFQSMI